jgi:hypothetical protein
MVGGRFAVVLVLGLVALGAASVVGKGGEGGPLPVQKSTCWECHSGWTPPLRTPAFLVPGGRVGAETGKELGYSMQVQNAWVQEIRAYTLTVDLTHAPSLNFRSTLPDIKDSKLLVIPGSAPTDPTQGVQAREAHTTLNLSTTPSGIEIKVAPKNTDPKAGPLVTVTLTLPDAAHTKMAKTAAAKGGAVEFKDDELLKALQGASGPLDIGVSLPAFSPADATTGLPSVTDERVGVDENVGFKLDALRQVPLSSPVFVEKGKGLLVGGLEFTVVKDAQDGEEIRFFLNTTNHYKHINTLTKGGDWANWTQDPVVVPVKMEGSKVTLEPASTTVVRLAPQNGPTLVTASEAVGYASAFLLVSSIASGGMFGKASRRGLNHLFGSAKRRVAFHNFLSYGVILAAAAHTVIFILETSFPWTVGIIWGGIAILAMLGLGVTGALQVPMIRRWNYATWRWTHYGMTVAAILFTIVHMLLDGAHFGAVQSAVHWSDPFNHVKAA